MEGIKEVNAEADFKEGCFYMDFLRVTKEKHDDLAKKGIPRIIGDMAFFQLVLNDQIYFNSDFALYSTTPLEGYRKWSDLFLT